MPKKIEKYLKVAKKWHKKNDKLVQKTGLIFFSLIVIVLFIYLLRFVTVGLFIDKEAIHGPAEKHQRGLNLVFYADQYKTWTDFNSDIDAIMRRVKSIEPWRSYNNFNVYRIFPGEEKKLCHTVVENERKPVLRCEKSINRYFSKLGLNQAKFIVLSRQNFQSWANVSRLANSGIFFSLTESLNQATEVSNGYLFLHLLGHAFGLKDEEKYVIAKAEGAPHTPDGPNCAPDMATAQKWWGNLADKYPGRVGYYKTCAGSDDFIRPSKGSLMNFGDLNDFIPSYEPVSTEYLNNILSLCFDQGVSTSSSHQMFIERYPEFTSCK